MKHVCSTVDHLLLSSDFLDLVYLIILFFPVLFRLYQFSVVSPNRNNFNGGTSEQQPNQEVQHGLLVEQCPHLAEGGITPNRSSVLSALSCLTVDFLMQFHVKSNHIWRK